jgi:hypothetical protein
MSRRVYLLGVGLALVALGLAFTDWALSLRPGVTEANVKRIRPGMSLEEVERIFGRAADSKLACPFGDMFVPCDWYRNWYEIGGEARLVFDAQNRVISAEFERNSENPGLLSRVRAWFGW